MQLFFASACLFWLSFQEVSRFLTLESLIVAHEFATDKTVLGIIAKALDPSFQREGRLLAAWSLSCGWFLVNTIVATPSRFRCCSILSFIANAKDNCWRIIHTIFKLRCVYHLRKFYARGCGFHHHSLRRLSVMIWEKWQLLTFHNMNLSRNHGFWDFNLWRHEGISILIYNLCASKLNWCLVQRKLLLMTCFTS